MKDYRDQRINSDFQALKRASNTEQTPLERFIRKGARLSEQDFRKVDKMSISTISTSKRFWIATAATAVVAAVLFFIPVSYSKTVGWDASLDLSAAQLNPDQLKSVAKELKAEIGAESVRLELERGVSGEKAEMTAFVDAGRNTDPNAKLQAFAKFLSAKGYSASAFSKPRVKELSGNVVAMTLDSVIEVEEEGKTAQELEAEITARLQEAGIKDVQVTVTKEADDKTRIEIEAGCQKGEGAEPDSECPKNMPDLVITKGGEVPQGAERVMAKVIKELVNGVEITVMKLVLKDKEAVIRISDMGKLSDPLLVGAMETQLKAQGIDYKVTIVDGEVSVGPFNLGPLCR